MPDEPRIAFVSGERVTVMCPHCMQEVGLPAEQPVVIAGTVVYKGALQSFLCPECGERIRLDN